jgi:hypothetical protein
MSYEPTNWKSGDVVTSAKLNKLEQGVAGVGGVLVVHGTIDESTGTDFVSLGKTWAEINAADVVVVVGEVSLSAGGAFKKRTSEVTTTVYNGQYVVDVGNDTLFTDSPDGYPAAEE